MGFISLFHPSRRFLPTCPASVLLCMPATLTSLFLHCFFLFLPIRLPVSFPHSLLASSSASFLGWLAGCLLACSPPSFPATSLVFCFSHSLITCLTHASLPHFISFLAYLPGLPFHNLPLSFTTCLTHILPASPSTSSECTPSHLLDLVSTYSLSQPATVSSISSLSLIHLSQNWSCNVILLFLMFFFNHHTFSLPLFNFSVICCSSSFSRLNVVLKIKIVEVFSAMSDS